MTHLLWKALGIIPGDVVAFTGGGGKTSLALAIARELPNVIFTTTTKLGPISEIPVVLSASLDSLPPFSGPVCVARFRDLTTQKLIGFPPEEIALLKQRFPRHLILVEADGSAGLPLKAPAEHEPVIPACADLVVAVAGASALGRPVAPGYIHRPELVAQLAPGAARVTPEVLAAALRACAKGAPPGARIVGAIGQGDLPGAATGLGPLRFARSVLAAPRTAEPVRAVTGDVTAILLAGGASRRFGGNKLLSPRGDRTLIESALQAPMRAGLREIIVVTGAYHDSLAPLLSGYPVRVVRNPDWAEGMSTSLRAGLLAARDAKAVIICLADQPLLPAAVIDQLVKRWQASGAPVVAPSVGGSRRNPVLFDRALFEELGAVTGDEGGRSVVQRHAVEMVTVPFTEEGWFADVDLREES